MKKVVMSYDKDADVLYISLGNPKKAIGREISSGIVERIDPKSKKIVGYTVVELSKRKEIEVPLRIG